MQGNLRALLLISFLVGTAVYGVADHAMSGLAQSSINNVTLYARLDRSVPAHNGMILSTAVTWNGQQISDAYGENVFILYPILGQPLRISGTVFFRVWLKSNSPTFGRVMFSLSEVSLSGDTKEITKTDGYVGVNPTASDFNFAVASINRTIEPSSSLQFRFVYTSTNPSIKVNLLWNDPRTPTQVVVPCIDHMSAALGIIDKDGKPITAYNANKTEGKTGVWTSLDVIDPFGLNDLETVMLSITNPTGEIIVDSQPMTLESHGASFYSGRYVFNTSFPVGMYSVVTKVLDRSGNAYYVSKVFAISYFYLLQLEMVDDDDHPLSWANYTISSDSTIYAVGQANASGWATQELPSSNIVGKYDVDVQWKNAQLTVTSGLNLTQSMTIHLKASIFKVTARYLLYGIPLSGATVKLIKNSSVVSNATTGLDGSATFYQISPGEYIVRVHYLSYEYDMKILVEKSSETVVALEIPYLGRIPYVAVLVAMFAILGLLIRRRRRPYSATISILDNLIDGGLPQSATLMIIGPSASGKTALAENLMYASLSKKTPCVFVATMQFPSEIRKELKTLGFDISEHEREGRLVFVDCYSAAAGKTSEEKYSVSSVSDLTRLGTELSTCLENLGKGTEVYLDSLAPWVSTIKPEFILSFIHATGAKVKAEEGRFYFTVGTSVDREFLTKIDEASDGVIELTMVETEKEPKRRLAIRKIRGRKHSSRWLDFSIVEGEGLIFQIPRMTLGRLRKLR